jgi:hypothetical protein
LKSSLDLGKAKEQESLQTQSEMKVKLEETESQLAWHKSELLQIQSTHYQSLQDMAFNHAESLEQTVQKKIAEAAILGQQRERKLAGEMKRSQLEHQAQQRKSEGDIEELRQEIAELQSAVQQWADAYEEQADSFAKEMEIQTEKLLEATNQFVEASREIEEKERRIDELEEETGKLHADADARLEQHQEAF